MASLIDFVDLNSCFVDSRHVLNHQSHFMVPVVLVSEWQARGSLK